MRFNIVCGAILHGLWCALRMLAVLCGERNFKRRREHSLSAFFFGLNDMLTWICT